MLKKALTAVKLALQVISVALLGFAISLGIHISVGESVRMPTTSEMGSLDNVSGDLDSKEARAVDLSRQSILQVLRKKKRFFQNVWHLRGIWRTVLCHNRCPWRRRRL